MTKEDLIAFEAEMIELFSRGKIKAPLHLAGGNENHLIKIFEEIEHEDWVLCSWRAHYHCLLKGVPLEMLRGDIVRGRSIALCYPQYRILSSAIVGGIAPIAVGIAWAIKESGSGETVHVFVGDMTAESGIVHESMKYAARNDLPIRWIVEDNGLSVMSDTDETWGTSVRPAQVTRYIHKLPHPHVGIGRHVSF